MQHLLIPTITDVRQVAKVKQDAGLSSEYQLWLF